ncbi:MAG TPA: DUF4394 domain-containing protein [Planctomycetota bacterium]|nr:DUF4394 domain-containing protein [Planctomycetota bacterium]
MRKHIAMLALSAVLLLAGAAHAEDVFGITTTNLLVRFSTSSPGTLISSVPVTGLQSGESIVGIDFRPNTGQLYGLGNSNRLYVINVVTGAATALGTTSFTPALVGTAFGMDFNPTADRLRVVTDTGMNLRLDPRDGTVQSQDFSLAYAPLDPNEGAVPHIVGAAYTDNYAGAPATTLYDIDSTQDVLVTQGSIGGTISPNGSGSSTPLFTIGKLGVDASDNLGFDISGASGTAYASIQVIGETASKLFTINLATGTATLLGAIGSTDPLRDISVVPPPTTFDVVALRTNNTLVRFDHRVPSLVTNSVNITGLQTGESILGIDFRPANGKLYGLGSTSRLYTIDYLTGAATQVGTGAFSTALNGTEFGVDFNPVVDRLRVTSNTEQNLRIDPDTAAVTVDTPLAYVAGDPNVLNPNTNLPNPNVIGGAYAPAAASGNAPLYAIDSTQDVLLVIGTTDGSVSPNTGEMRTIGALGLNAGTQTGFDITSNGNVTSAFAAINNGFYTINLTTGAATQVGNLNIGGGVNIRGIAVIPQTAEAILQFSADSFYVIEKNTASITVTRTGGTQGTVSVDYAITGGTATAGTDYTASSGTLVFVDGETSRTIFIPALDDNILELFETVTLQLQNPIGAELGAQTTTRLDIADKDDHDGDGFINAIETAFGSSPTSATSTPFNGAPAGTAQPLTVLKAGIKLNFIKPLSDSIAIAGELPFPTGFTTDGKDVIVNIGGVNGIIKTFKLDAKGKSTPKSSETFAIGLKPKNGVSKYAIKLSKNDYRAQLAEEGFTADADLSKVERTLQINIYFNNVNYQVTKTFIYSAKKGKSGSATLQKPPKP